MPALAEPGTEHGERRFQQAGQPLIGISDLADCPRRKIVSTVKFSMGPLEGEVMLIKY